MQTLQEQMRRGMNLAIRDESENGREEGQATQEEEKILNLEEERIFKAITKIGKDLSSMFPHF